MLETNDIDKQLLHAALARLNGVFATNTLRAYRADNLNFIKFCTLKRGRTRRMDLSRNVFQQPGVEDKALYL